MDEPRLHSLVQAVFDAGVASRVDPWFERYCGPMRDPAVAARVVGFRRHLLRMAGVQPGPDAVVLDAGCGFGPNCLGFYVMGFRHIHGVDFYEPMIQAVRAYLPVLGLEDAIEARTGDVADLSRIYPGEFFDLILSNEAISHYRDVDAFLREAFLVLKPGGVLLVADANNGANPRIRRMNQRIWDAFENGPPQKVYSHTVKTPYVEMRKEIIRDAVPDLDARAVDDLAANTFRMARGEIVEASRRYVEDGTLPGSRYRPGICPLEPRQNQLIENLFDPPQLVKDMRRHGFAASAYSYLGGATRGGAALLVNRLWQALSPITLHLGNVFVIIARKPGVAERRAGHPAGGPRRVRPESR